MPRIPRAPSTGVVSHVYNRSNAGATVFADEHDYAAFVALLAEACDGRAMRIIGYCLMPNHFHLLLRPPRDGDLSGWMQWLMTSHVRRHHRCYGTSGHLWQGRFKSFPVQSTRVPAAARRRPVAAGGDAVLAVLRYVERNPVRAGLVARAEAWPWSSAAVRLAGGDADAPPLTPPPGGLPANWAAWLNRPQTDEELADLRRCVRRGAPFGRDPWVQRIAADWGLQSTLHPRGRPKKGGHRSAERQKK